MIRPNFFYNLLIRNGTEFFAGIPDSLLKNFCAYLTDNVAESSHIIAANEGCAVGIACGNYFASGKIPLVYMQNSGLGNAVNPLLSLADKEVYSVPLLLLIGWRGEPNVHDEPQHIKQGQVTCSMLETMQIPYCVLDGEEESASFQIETAYKTLKKESAPYAIVIRKGIFSEYKLKISEKTLEAMNREEAIEQIILNAPKDSVFVSTTGMVSRELYELREKYNQKHDKDFLTVGSMGHACQIALGIALKKPDIKVFCLDGDGAAIMHLGAWTSIGVLKPKNFVHIVLNNGAHDSVGGQPTVGHKINFCGLADASGYDNIFCIKCKDSLAQTLKEVFSTNRQSLTFIEVFVSKGARSDLGRPKSSPIENKVSFMNTLKI